MGRSKARAEGNTGGVMCVAEKHTAQKERGKERARRKRRENGARKRRERAYKKEKKKGKVKGKQKQNRAESAVLMLFLCA